MSEPPIFCQRTTLFSRVHVACSGWTTLSGRVGSVDFCREFERDSAVDQLLSIWRNRYVIVESIDQRPDRKRRGFLASHSDGVDERMTFVLRTEVNCLRVGRPSERSDPLQELFGQVFLLAGLAVVEHQAKAVALVSGTLLGAVGDVAAVRRIERRRVAGGIVGGDVLGLRQNSLCPVLCSG